MKQPTFFYSLFTFSRNLSTRLLSALRAAINARPIHFTRFGSFYILFSLAVGAAAINTGNNLLYLMLGLLLGFIIISGFLSDSCLWGLELEFLPIGDFYAGQSAEWDLIARKSWFPAILLRVETVWPRLTQRHFFYWVPRYGVAQQQISLTPAQRGPLTLQMVRYATSFPFGLFEKSRQIRGRDQWVVFPRVEPLPVQVLRAAGLNSSDQPAGRKGHGAIPFDLRNYRTGDSSNRIHWKSSAKRGRWMVSEMEEESNLTQLVEVRSWPTEAAELEAFISFLASLVCAFYRQNRPIGLLTPGIAFETARSPNQLKKILTYLALLDPAMEPAAQGPAHPSPAGSLDAYALWKRHREAGRTVP